MTWEPRPVPHVTPETEPYWTAAAGGQLLLSKCTDCSLVFHYPRGFCPDCFSKAVDWLEAVGMGDVYSYSTVRNVSGWPDENLPLIVAYVELEEGPRVMTNLFADPEAVDIGTRVEVQFVDTEELDVAVPIFVPVED